MGGIHSEKMTWQPSIHHIRVLFGTDTWKSPKIDIGQIPGRHRRVSFGRVMWFARSSTMRLKPFLNVRAARRGSAALVFHAALRPPGPQDALEEPAGDQGRLSGRSPVPPRTPRR